jgi:hypothetical protein
MAHVSRVFVVSPSRTPAFSPAYAIYATAGIVVPTAALEKKEHPARSTAPGVLFGRRTPQAERDFHWAVGAAIGYDQTFTSGHIAQALNVNVYVNSSNVLNCK